MASGSSLDGPAGLDLSRCLAACGAACTCKAPALTVVRAGAKPASPDRNYGVCVMKLVARLETTKFVNAASSVSTWL